MSGSRFFAGSDTESESSSDGDDPIVQTRPTTTRAAFVWSDDEEDVKRVVRSEKEKRWEDMKNVIKALKNHKKIKDMQKVQSDFEDLTKSFDKSKKVIDREGIPNFYIQTLAELEDFITECWDDRDWRKTLSKNGDKAMRNIRQRLKRYLRDNDLEDKLTAYRENPDAFKDDDDDDERADVDDDSDDDDDDDAGVAVAKAPSKVKATAPKDDDDDEEWPSDSSSSSDEEDLPTGVTYTAAYFLKNRQGDDDKEKQDRKEKKLARQQELQEKARRREEEEEAGGEWHEVVQGGGSISIQEKPKIFSQDTKITIEAVSKKLAEFVTARGKKGTDRMQMIELVTELRSIAAENKLGLAMDTKLLFGVISSIFDYNPNIASSMKDELWTKCLTYVRELLDVLVDNQGQLKLLQFGVEEQEQLEGDTDLRIRGNILNLVERMDEEYVKVLQSCDAHSTDYIERLRDEHKVCAIIEDVQRYIESMTSSTNEERCRIYLKRIEHFYYKFDRNPESNVVLLMDQLCKFIYDFDQTDRLRTRAMLCQIYHLALHDRWYDARDLMLMSHLQDSISAADIPTQIMYNRAMVQLGLCAFRQGMTRDAHNCLVDLQSSGRAKELLAQGLLLQRQHERTAEQEKIEKRRQMPFHMHINLELIECVYLVSAMLMEIPYMAQHEFDARRRMISKNFHHVLRVSDRQPLLGPPESMREHLVAASKAMKSGSWRDCHGYIINDKMNAKVWDLFQNADKVRLQLSDKIKVESLRTYLFSYSSVYDSISLDKLAAMFELERAAVHSTVSKMIISEELAASMDEPSQCVIMHRTDPTHLQSMALQLSEKVQSLVDFNEKLMELKSGNYSFQRQGDQRQQGQYQMPNRFQQQQSQQGRYNQKQGYSNRYHERRIHFE